MKCINRLYKTEERPDFTGIKKELADFRSLLIQVFSGLNDIGQLQEILDSLSKAFPSAVITGASTAGEIFEGRIYDDSLVISFCGFEKTDLESVYIPECSREQGHNTGHFLKGLRDIKAALIFTQGLNGHPEDLIKGISEVHPELIFAGGAAGDGERFCRTYVIHGSTVYTEGATVTAFINPDLIVTTAANLGYTPIGTAFEVTKAEGNILMEINGRPVREMMEHYLGSEVIRNLPEYHFSQDSCSHIPENFPPRIVQFPFLAQRNGQWVARSPVAALGDGSLVYAGNFYTGEKIRFGLIDIDNIISQTLDARTKISSRTAEAIWIYSCMGRRSQLYDALQTEMSLLSFGIPVSGLFTYGEFFASNSRSDMLNLTTTLFALSESAVRVSVSGPQETKNTFKSTQIGILSHLIKTVSVELDQVNNFLEGYRLATDYSSIVSITDPEGIITYVNDAFCSVTGYSRSELVGRTHAVVKHPETPPEKHKAMWDTIKQGKIWKGIYRNRSRSGESLYLDSTIVPFRDQNNQITQFICVRHDITKIVRQERTIEQQYIDPLTGLPNRIRFFRDLEDLKNPAVGLFNVDRFQDINNFYGFESGDLLLRMIADAILKWAEPGFHVYRSDRDEFIISVDAEDPSGFFKELRILSEYMNNTVFELSGHSVMIRSAIGAAQGKKQILSRAESALKTARRKRLGFWVSTESDEKKQLENFRKIGMIRRAVERDQIIPFFQPIQRVRDGRITAYEALIRLRDDEGNIQSPLSFLELAKHARYYYAMQAALIRKAMNIFMKRKEVLSLNLTADDIQNHDMVRFIISEISRFPEPKRLVFEITESEAIEDFKKVHQFINEIEQFGARTAIDDFGSGYSNFSYLTRLNVSYLKIDGSIISEIYTNSSAYHTLEIITDLAKRLRMKTVAEYVSDARIAQYAKEAGVDYFQGYHVGLPVEFPD